MRKQANLVQFLNTRVVLINKQLEEVTLPRKFRTEYIFITGNPYTSIAQLNHAFNYDRLILDANNSAAVTERLKRDALTHHINYWVLRRNNALVVASN